MRYTIKDGVTQSLLQNWLACRQRAKWGLEGWYRPGAVSRSLQFGTMFHFFLERYYGKSIRDFRKLESAWVRTRDYREDADRHGAEMDIAISAPLFEQYKLFWKDDDASKRWVVTEQVFDVVWKGFRLRGKVDGAYLKGDKHNLWLLETKTAGRIEEEILDDTLVFDFQNLFYMLGMSLHYKKPIKGVLRNIIRHPGIRTRGLSPRTVSERVLEECADKPEHYFKRFEIPYSKRMQDRFQKELLAKLIVFREWLNGDPSYPTYRSECSCVTRYVCNFLPACAADGLAGYRQDEGRLFSELEK